MQLALDRAGINAIDYRALPRSSKNLERNKAKEALVNEGLARPKRRNLMADEF